MQEIFTSTGNFFFFFFLMGGRTEHQTIIHWSFQIFLKFPDFLKSKIEYTRWQLLYTSLLSITMLYFTYGERKIYSTIKHSQNIVNMILSPRFFIIIYFIGTLIVSLYNNVSLVFLKTILYLLLFLWKMPNVSKDVPRVNRNLKHVRL